VLVLNNALLEHGSNRLTKSDIAMQDEVAHWLFRTTTKRRDESIRDPQEASQRSNSSHATMRTIYYYLAHRVPRFFVRCHDRKPVEQRRNYPLRLFGPVVP
jgi:hypothetical protein